MERTKENALVIFKRTIEQSWTYDKMTESERDKFWELVEHTRIQGVLKGTFKQRYEILNAVYYAYLIALGYTWNWRES